MWDVNECTLPPPLFFLLLLFWGLFPPPAEASLRPDALNLVSLHSEPTAGTPWKCRGYCRGRRINAVINYAWLPRMHSSSRQPAPALGGGGVSVLLQTVWGRQKGAVLGGQCGGRVFSVPPGSRDSLAQRKLRCPGLTPVPIAACAKMGVPWDTAAPAVHCPRDEASGTER